MPIILGAMVGENEVLGSDSIDITLTANVPVGNPTTAEGLILVTAKQQFCPSPTTMDISDAMCRPNSVVDTAPLATPYYLPNRLLARMAWQGSPGALVGIGPGSNIVNFENGVLFNGAFFYLILSPLSIGDVITVDYSHNTKQIDWLGARVYRVTGIRGDSDSAPVANVTQPDSSVFNASATTASQMPFSGTYTFTDFITVAGAFAAFAGSTSAMSWYGSSGLEVVWTSGSPLSEIDHWTGFLDNFGSPHQWRLGYAFHDFAGSSVDGRINEQGGGDSRAGWSFAYSEEGPGWPLPSPNGLYLSASTVS